MKRIERHLLSLALCAALPFAVAEEVVISADRVNLRAAPVPDAEVVGQASYGERLALHGSLSDPWVAVSVPEAVDLWVSSELLDGDTVRVNRANLRSGAGVNHAIVGRVERGEKLVVRGRTGEWTRIAPPQIPAVSVYVTNLYVKAWTPPPPAAEPVPPPPPVAEPAPPPPPVTPAAVSAPRPPSPPSEDPAPAPGMADEVATLAPERPVAPASAPSGGLASDKGRHTILSSPPANDPPVGPAAIPASKLREGVVQAEPGAYSGTLARSPVFGAHPAKFRLVHFDANGTPTTVCYVYGNSRQLDSMKGDALTVSGAVYWFKGSSMPVVFAQEILRATAK